MIYNSNRAFICIKYFNRAVKNVLLTIPLALKACELMDLILKRSYSFETINIFKIFKSVLNSKCLMVELSVYGFKGVATFQY